MLQLVLDANGNYTYKNVSSTSNNITSKDFEAYQGEQKTKLASDTTNIGTQTETLLRERPGTITTTTDPKTGEVKTTGGAQQVGIQSDMPTGTGMTTTPINPFDRVQSIIGSTQMPGASAADKERIFNLIRDQQKLQQRAQKFDQITKVADMGFRAYNMLNPAKTTIPGTTGPITPLTQLSSIPVGQATVGSVAGAGAIAYGVGSAFKVKEKKGMAAGASIGMAAGGPIGAVIGGVVGGVAEAVFGGSVICTELYKQKLMSKEDYRLSWNFTIDNFSDTHINGYWYWAVPMVKVMKKNKLVTKFWNHVMSNRTKDIKWRLKKGKFNLLGRLYSILIENGSYVVGKLICKNSKEVLI